MAYQITVKEPVKVEGLNIYTGRKNKAVFHPAEEDEGMVFYSRGRRIPASLENARYGFYAIDLEKDGGKVRLVEHALPPAYVQGIDNAIIELSDGVFPTTDDSGKELFLGLKEALAMQPAKRKFWRYAKDKETHIPPPEGKPDSLVAGPSKGFVIDCRNYYPHKAVGNRQFRMEVNARNYENCVMEARSQGFVDTPFKKLLFSLRRGGPLGELGWHGINERNYLIISSRDSESYGNPPGYEPRYGGEEFERHTMKDKIGTVALTGRQFRDTEFRFDMTGHEFDLHGFRELFRQGCFEECEHDVIDVWEYTVGKGGDRHYLESVLINNRPAAFKGAPGFIRTDMRPKPGEPDVFEARDEWNSEEELAGFYGTERYENGFARSFSSFWKNAGHKGILKD